MSNLTLPLSVSYFPAIKRVKTTPRKTIFDIVSVLLSFVTREGTGSNRHYSAVSILRKSKNNVEVNGKLDRRNYLNIFCHLPQSPTC